MDTIKGMFLEVKGIEEAMLARYEEILSEITDPSMKKSLNEIISDEKRHLKNAKEMIRILEE